MSKSINASAVRAAKKNLNKSKMGGTKKGIKGSAGIMKSGTKCPTCGVKM